MKTDQEKIEEVEKIVDWVNQGYFRDQIAIKLKRSQEYVRQIGEEFSIDIPTYNMEHSIDEYIEKHKRSFALDPFNMGLKRVELSQ